MKSEALISHAFEDLAQSLRVLLEADFRANRGGLLATDRPEAVGNIETALSSVLNAFHSLYDAVEKQLKSQPIDWHSVGELAIVLAIRNARHHNKANRIRTLYTYHAHEAPKPTKTLNYVLIDFPALDEGADTFDVCLSWGDLSSLLQMPKAESRIASETVKVIRKYLHSENFESYAQTHGVPPSRVFFNVVPLLVNAGAKIVPLIKTHIKSDSTESEFFSYHFATVTPADVGNPEVLCCPFALPS